MLFLISEGEKVGHRGVRTVRTMLGCWLFLTFFALLSQIRHANLSSNILLERFSLENTQIMTHWKSAVDSKLQHLSRIVSMKDLFVYFCFLLFPRISFCYLFLPQSQRNSQVTRHNLEIHQDACDKHLHFRTSQEVKEELCKSSENTQIWGAEVF